MNTAITADVDLNAGFGIQELSFGEIEDVDGGIAPLLVAVAVVGAVAVVSFAVGAVCGYLAN